MDCVSETMKERNRGALQESMMGGYGRQMDDPGIPVQGVIFTLRTRGWEQAGWAEAWEDSSGERAE